MFVLQFYLKQVLQKSSPSSLGTYTFALRNESSFRGAWGGRGRGCACLIQNCEYLFTSTLKSQESLSCVSVHTRGCAHTWVCTCMLGAEAGPLRGTTCDRVERCVLCVSSAREPRDPSPTSAELLKAKTGCAVLLSTLVAFWKFLNF